jgi:hypothetical protein
LKDVKYPDIKWNIDTYARGKALEEIHEFLCNMRPLQNPGINRKRDAIIWNCKK